MADPNARIYESDTIEALAMARQTRGDVYARRFIDAAERTPEMATDYETMASWFCVAVEAGREAGWNAAQPQWQPIDSAPKDGTEVLLAVKNPGGWVQIGWWWNNGWYACYPDDGETRIEDQTDPPTHWMPRPTPPTGADER